MRLALGQMNATIGDFAANGAKIEALRKEAEAAEAHLLLVPASDDFDEVRPFEPAKAPTAELRPGQIERAEYERQQAVPGLRVSTKVFGSDRRIPIAQVSKA